MAIDTFTGGLTSGGALDWSDTGAWSFGELPGSSHAAILDNPSGSSVGYGTLASADNETVTGLQLASGFTLTISGSLDDQGSSSGVSSGLIVMQGGTFTNDNANSADTIDFSHSGGTVNLGVQLNTEGNGAFSGVIEGMNTASTLDIVGPSGGAASGVISHDGTQYVFGFGGGLESYAVNFDSTANLSVVQSGDEYIITSSSPVCFTSGTRIKTTRGEIAVEALAVGDLAVTVSGEARPIVWIGHKRVDRPAREAWPVRVTAGAFGENQPSRDLFLSPGHAVCVSVMDEMFVPVSKLINGVTIARVEVAEVTYWHVELESHDVLLAEGLPAESYMDAGNRAFFGRAYGGLAAVDPERVAESLTRYARPFVDNGPIVEAIRQRLVARAETLGWLAAEVGAAA